ncbi:hypothetical protein [Nocardia otitidiscaviarum]|uniref:hypothetical protein n=1 Tax=Nocardia otitidiscaviarum TaxID=1823 RepID=UPI0024554AE2|nr:hypothetical protein [Nocardia otitidiscaviarum]
MSTRRVEVPHGRSVVLADPVLPEPVAPRRTESDARGHRPGEACFTPGCADCRWDEQRLKYWLRGRLLAAGAETAHVDGTVGPLDPDVLWRQGDRVCAIQVCGAVPDLTRARHRTAALKAAGCTEVLWLCPPGWQIAHLPALALSDFAPADCDYRAVGGQLTPGPGGLVTPGDKPWEIRDFIENWVAGEVAYGYRDEHTGGWATVADWERHTRTQAAVIARQRRELMNQRTALALSRKAARDRSKLLSKLTHRLERAESSAQQHADELALAQRRIADHDRVDATLRLTVRSQRQALVHWQLISWFALMVIMTFLVAAFVVLD